MAGNTLGAPPCTSTRKEEEKRKQNATKGEKAKKQRPSEANVVEHEHPSGTAVPVTPLHCAPSNSMAMPSPIAGFNGAALCWSTAATSASMRTAEALSLPVMANANGPWVPSVLAPALGLQAPGAESNMPMFAPPMPMANVHGFPAYLVSARPEGQLVFAPLQYIGHGPIASVRDPEASAVGLPLAVALLRLKNDTLGRLLSALMPACHPPLQHYQSKTGAPPPWWPTASEHWWVPEVEAHLGKMPVDTPVPFSAGYNLKKTEKVAVLVAIVKHLTPDFSRISTAVSRSKLTESEAHMWNNALRDEHAKCMRAMMFIQLQPQQQPHSDGHPLAPSETTSGGIIASDGCAQVVNLCGASVTAPANDGVQVVAGLEQEQHSNGAIHGDIIAVADAPQVENGREQPVNFPGDDSVPFGATVAALTDDVVYDLEPQLEEHGDVSVATAEEQPDDTLAALLMQQEEEAHQVADVEAFGAASPVADAPEDHNYHIFANINIPPGTPHSFDDGWF